ncbi:MAG: hypothetical protein QXK54_03995 [Ignisphaera sp.]
MYTRIITRFCNSIHLEKYPVVMIRRNELAIRISYSYLSVSDICIANCFLVASSHKPMGSISIGRVIHRGVDVENIYEGMRVALFPINSPLYLETLGGAQEVAVIDHHYVKSAELRNYNDIETMLIAALSVEGGAVDLVKGKDVLIIGNDISILTFAYYASRYSCRIGIIPKLTINSKVLKGEHVSLHNSDRKFETIIVATPDPMAICLAIKNLATHKATIVLYPHLHKLLNGICINNKEVKIITIALGDMQIGAEVFENFKEFLMKEITIVDPEDLTKHISRPLILRFR